VQAERQLPGPAKGMKRRTEDRGGRRRREERQGGHCTVVRWLVKPSARPIEPSSNPNIFISRPLPTRRLCIFRVRRGVSVSVVMESRVFSLKLWRKRERTFIRFDHPSQNPVSPRFPSSYSRSLSITLSAHSE
jgi:hypothetical protein